MKARETGAKELLGSDTGITLHNHLSPGHRYRAVMDEVFRVALRGLPGPWEVSVTANGRAWFRIDVVAPDGASWSMTVPVNVGPRSEDLAETVRVARSRQSRLRPAASKTKVAGDAADCPGAAGWKVLPPRGEAAHPTSHDSARRTPK
jgi:hypothetical protein